MSSPPPTTNTVTYLPAEEGTLLKCDFGPLPPPLKTLSLDTKGSQNALAGKLVERLLCTQPSVKLSLEARMGKSIKNIVLVPGNTKSDNHIEYEDGTKDLIQSKNHNGTAEYDGWGHHLGRGDISKYTNSEGFRTLYKNVCLNESNERPEISKTVSKELLAQCLFGSVVAKRPKYVFLTKLSADRKELVGLKIISATDLVEHIEAGMFPKMYAKGPRIYMSPNFYVKRHGADETDSCPDDVQAMLLMRPKPIYSDERLRNPTNLTTKFQTLFE